MPDAKMQAVIDVLPASRGVRQACASVGVQVPEFFFKLASNRAKWEKPYADAKAAQVELLAESIHDVPLDYLERKGATGVQAALVKTYVDSLKWTLARTMPKKYGDRLSIDDNSSTTAEKLRAALREIDRKTSGDED
jgi:hypothetical protein